MTEDLATLLQQPHGDPCRGLSTKDAARFKWWLQLGLLEMHVTAIATNPMFSLTHWHEAREFEIPHPYEDWSYRFKR